VPAHPTARDERHAHRAPVTPMYRPVVDDRPLHRVKDYVVYPGVGVCRVTRIKSLKFGKTSRKCYILKVLSDRANIVLPVANAHRVSLRKVISKKEVSAVFNVLKNPSTRRIKDWKKRQALISEKVASGDSRKAAEVYQRLFFLAKTKGLSHGENVAFVKVRTFLSDELSIVGNTTNESTLTKIDKILEKSYQIRLETPIDDE